MHSDSDREIRRAALDSDDAWESETGDSSHATTGGAAAAGAVTGGVIGLTGGPVGAAIGAVGGAIVGAAAERMMHSDDADRPSRGPMTSDDEPPLEIEEPIGPPLAEVEPEAQPKEPRPLI